MNIKERVQKLDEMTAAGQILEALEEFYHPELTTREGNDDEVTSKEAHRKKLETFFSGIEKVNGIEFHSSAVGDGVSMSEFTFDMVKKDGDPILWNEILRRRWKDGLVIDERYYTA